MKKLWFVRCVDWAEYFVDDDGEECGAWTMCFNTEAKAMAYAKDARANDIDATVYEAKEVC